ncbi:hypothetical protein quinque_001967 [Culex quinquefasciatus]
MDTEDSTSEGGDGSTKVIEVNIPTSNQFDGLEDEQGDDPISLPPNPTPPPVLRIGEPAKGKKVRVPPISVVGKSTRQLREFLGQSRIQQTAFNMKATKTGVQLICSGEDTFRSALAALRGANIQYHTYTPAAEQPMKVVLSGLPVLIALRNTRRRQWYRRRDPIYQDIVSSLNRRIREECNQANFNKFKDTLRTLHDDRDTLWRITKALRKTTKYSPPWRKGTNIIASSSEKAKLLAASFASAHTNQMPDDQVTVAEVNNSIDAIDRTPLADNHSWLVRPKEVAQLIRRLKAKKTPGQDQLRNIVLKRLTRKAHIFIAKIFSTCVRLGYFPAAWKHAVVIGIRKPNKDATNPSNYRPISLLPTLSKLLERVILVRIDQHLENTRVIPDTQFGFKRGHSTNHQLVRLVKEVRANFARRKSAGMVLLDVEKEYDSVWQEAILHKMYLANFSLYILKIVRSFLQKRSYHVVKCSTFAA